jgi:prophage antirepressor-like protein
MKLNLIQHPEFGEIRTEIINNEMWFCGKDVCNVLGYEKAREAPRMHCRAKGAVKRGTPTNGGVQDMIFINEGNLYRLILKSRLPAAEKFESWVCDEVLPTIRKNGNYSTAQKRVLRHESEDMEVMRMLITIDSFLLPGDKQGVAAQVGVSRQTVHRVITGYHRSPRILSALFERALQNSRVVNGNLYLSPNETIDKLINPN